MATQCELSKSIFFNNKHQNDKLLLMSRYTIVFHILFLKCLIAFIRIICVAVALYVRDIAFLLLILTIHIVSSLTCSCVISYNYSIC